MKKILIAAIVGMVLFSCSKEKVDDTGKKLPDFEVQAVAIDIDGTQSFSPITHVKN